MSLVIVDADAKTQNYNFFIFFFLPFLPFFCAPSSLAMKGPGS